MICCMRSDVKVYTYGILLVLKVSNLGAFEFWVLGLGMLHLCYN